MDVPRAATAAAEDVISMTCLLTNNPASGIKFPHLSESSFSSDFNSLDFCVVIYFPFPDKIKQDKM